MTMLQMNAELFRELSIIAEDETMMQKLLKYAKKLTAKKSDPTLMSKEDFFNKVDEAREEIRQGGGLRFTDRDTMNDWLDSL